MSRIARALDLCEKLDPNFSSSFIHSSTNLIAFCLLGPLLITMESQMKKMILPGKKGQRS